VAQHCTQEQQQQQQQQILGTSLRFATPPFLFVSGQIASDQGQLVAGTIEALNPSNIYTTPASCSAAACPLSTLPTKEVVQLLFTHTPTPLPHGARKLGQCTTHLPYAHLLLVCLISTPTPEAVQSSPIPIHPPLPCACLCSAPPTCFVLDCCLSVDVAPHAKEAVNVKVVGGHTAPLQHLRQLPLP
jgi:hypothetical protein